MFYICKFKTFTICNNKR